MIWILWGIVTVALCFVCAPVTEAALRWTFKDMGDIEQ